MAAALVWRGGGAGGQQACIVCYHSRDIPTQQPRPSTPLSRRAVLRLNNHTKPEGGLAARCGCAAPGWQPPHVVRKRASPPTFPLSVSLLTLFPTVSGSPWFFQPALWWPAGMRWPKPHTRRAGCRCFIICEPFTAPAAATVAASAQPAAPPPPPPPPAQAPGAAAAAPTCSRPRCSRRRRRNCG